MAQSARFGAHMSYKGTQSLRWQRFLMPAFYALAVMYIGYHTFNGDRGLYAWVKEQRHLTELQQELTQVNQAQMDLQKRISLMQPNSLDLDMLDEQVRKNIGAAGMDEMVVYIDPEQMSSPSKSDTVY